MEALLSGSDARFPVLRLQYGTATVKDRQFSGVGFFTDFEVPPGTTKVAPPNFELGSHVLLQLEGLQHGAGVVLFVRDGVIQMLEGYTFDEPWPADPRLLGIEGPTRVQMPCPPNQRLKLSGCGGRPKGNSSLLIAPAAPRSLSAIR